MRELSIEFEDGRINYKTCLLKIEKLLELQRIISNLLHSMMVDGKKEVFKKLCFVLKKKKLDTLLVVCNECFTGIKLKR